MNKQRRKKLSDIFGTLTELKDKLEEIQAEEQATYDNMPEGLQQSEKGEQISEYAYPLDERVSSISDVCDSLEEIICG